MILAQFIIWWMYTYVKVSLNITSNLKSSEVEDKEKWYGSIFGNEELASWVNKNGSAF